MDSKEKISIGFKLKLFMAVSIAVIVSISVAIAYFIHAKETDDFYRYKTGQIALTCTNFLDGDYLKRLVEAVETPEFQELRQRAEDMDDDELLRQWLAERGLYEKYLEHMDFLAKFQKDMGDVKYLYIIDIEEDEKIFYDLLDPQDTHLYELGVIEDKEEEFYDDALGNVHLDATINNGPWGWVSSGYEPIRDSSGTAVASMGVDIAMTDVMAKRQEFLFIMLLCGSILGVLAYFLSIVIVRRMVVHPLVAVTGCMKQFTPSEKGSYEDAHVMNLSLTGRDEIRDLHDGIRDMQIHIVDYLANITRITVEKERIGAELDVARHIQEELLPTYFPDSRNFDIYASMTPAKEVGGDFYDFFFVDDGHLAMVMADVSGKGVPAALFMAIAKTLIKNRAVMGGTPCEILMDVNQQLCENNGAELFVTVWLGILELATGKCTVANAGHEYPAIRHGNGSYELHVGDNDPPLAAMEGLPFSEEVFVLQPGDSLFLYTDGVPEAKSADKKQFGSKHMLETLNRVPEASPKELLEHMERELRAFSMGRDLFDDITMLCLKYRGN